MKRKVIYAAICCLAATFCYGCRNESAGIGSGSGKVKIPIKEYMIGADISWVQAAEDRGVRYSDNGVQKDILEILKDHGFNYIRLRVFVDPTKATTKDRPYSMQGYCDLSHTIAMAKRVKAAGMGLFIDFHYSDSWADPGKQFTPSSWANLSFDELVKKTHDYTNDRIKQFKAAGAPGAFSFVCISGYLDCRARAVLPA